MAIEYPSSLTTSTPHKSNDDEQNSSSHSTIESTSPTALQCIFAGIILGSAGKRLLHLQIKADGWNAIAECRTMCMFVKRCIIDFATIFAYY